jgi:hypothetical protein
LGSIGILHAIVGEKKTLCHSTKLVPFKGGNMELC